MQHDAEIAPAVGQIGLEGYGPFEHKAGLRKPALVLPDGSKAVESRRVVGLGLQGALQQGLAPGQVAAPALHDRQAFEPIGIIRIDGQQDLQQGLGLVQITAAERCSGRAEISGHGGQAMEWAQSAQKQLLCLSQHQRQTAWLQATVLPTTGLRRVQRW